MSDSIIQSRRLTKQYDGKAGCKNITLDVPRGVVFGFLGPNGAGKSTFVRTMLGLIKPTSGEAVMLGLPIGSVAARRNVGYLPELFRYPEWLTGRQLLQTHAELSGVPYGERKKRIDALLDRVGLTASADEKIKGYSKGMQQRIGLAASLISDPELLFLDEPTSALDPIGRKEVRELITELREQGKTIFLNSHLLSEVESVCDHVAIIHKGELIVQGLWRELSDIRTTIEIMAAGMGEAMARLDHPAVTGTERVGAKEGKDIWRLTLDEEEAIPDVIDRLSSQGARIYQVVRKEPGLEDVFIYWINRKEMERGVDRR